MAIHGVEPSSFSTDSETLAKSAHDQVGAPDAR